MNHFIATKSISSTLDSHQRVKMKCYFNEPGKTHRSETKWTLEACGTKDKYFGHGDNKIDIDPTLMHKISKNMYQLYADIKSMTDEEFQQHIDQLVAYKNTFASREEKIVQFRIKEKPERERVNVANLMAFERTMDAYPPLAAAIAREMVKTNLIVLSKLAELNYCHEDSLEPFLNAMSQQKKFDALQTANIEQLNYCLTNYAHHKDLSKQAKDFLAEKKSPIPEKSSTTPTDAAQQQTKIFPYVSRLQQAFFNQPCQSSTETASSEAISKDSAVSRLAGLSLFKTTFAKSEDQSEKEKREKLSKSCFIAKNH